MKCSTKVAIPPVMDPHKKRLDPLQNFFFGKIKHIYLKQVNGSGDTIRIGQCQCQCFPYAEFFFLIFTQTRFTWRLFWISMDNLGSLNQVSRTFFFLSLFQCRIADITIV